MSSTSQIPYTIAGAILAGGRSSRMGVPKAGVVISTGQTIFAQVLEQFAQLGLPCVVVGHGAGIDQRQYNDLIFVPDQVRDRGPVGALLGLFRSGIATHYLVAGCDQILLNKKLLQKLIDDLDNRPVVFGYGVDLLSPLPGIYPQTMLPNVEELLQQKSASLRKLLQDADTRIIPLPQEQFTLLRSVNTPGELKECELALFKQSHLS